MTPLDLIGRVETLAGPDREVDALIAIALGVASPDTRPAKGSVTGFISGDGRGGYGAPTVPRYTASLDAAMTLATGFVLLHLSDIGADGLPMAVVGDPSTTPSREWTGIAHNLASSVTLACLKARSADSLLVGER